MQFSNESRRKALWALAFALAGFAINCFPANIVPGASFLFGGIFWMIIALAFGPAFGAPAAAIAALPTLWIWGNPTALITRPLEALTVAWMVRRYRWAPIYADLAFWLVVGTPVSYAFQFLVLGVEGQLGWIILLKQPVNGVVNVVAAALLLQLPVVQRRLFSAECPPVAPPLRVTLLHAFTLVAAVPAIAFGLTHARNALQTTEAIELKHLEEVATAAQRQAESYLETRLNVVVSLASAIEHKGSMKVADLDHLLENSHAAHNGFHAILVTDTTGRILSAHQMGEPLTTNPIGASLSERDYFRETMATGQPFVSDAFLGRGTPANPIVVVTAPVRLSGETVGVVAGSLDLQRFALLATDHQGLEILLFDKRNRVVYATPDSGYSPLQDLSGDPLLARAQNAAQPTSLIYDWPRPSAKGDRRFLAATTFSPSTGWRISVQNPYRIVERQSHDFLLRVLAGLLLTVAACVPLVELLARSFTRPVERLAEAVRTYTLNRGREFTSLSSGSPHEVQTLVSGLEEMSARLENSHRETQTLLADLDQKVQQRTRQMAGEKALLEKIAAGEPLPTLLEAICREMESRVPGRMCTIQLISSDGSHLRHGAAPSFPPEYGQLVATLPVREGASPCSTASGGKRQEIVEDFETSAVYEPLRPAARRFGVRASWSTPVLSTGGELLGTFAIYSREPGLPARSDFELIERATSIAAIAIERHRAVETIQAHQRRLLDIMNSLTPFCGLFTLDGTVLEVNRSACESLGVSRAELIGKSFFDSYWISYSPEALSLYRQAFDRAALGETVRFDGPARVVPDRILTVDNVFSPVRDADGKVVQVIGSAVDITERKRLEDDLRQAQKMEAIGRLAGGVAHDFNNLLMVIRGHSEMLLDRVTQGPERKNAQEIQKAADRAAALTQQLLAFSRKQVLAPRILQLNDVLRDMESLLQRLIGAHIRLETRLGETGPVRADQGQLEQVIMNLAVNARDAMPDGGSLIIATQSFRQTAPNRAYLDLAPGDYVVLAVRDTGVGMDEQTKTRLFEPFFTTKGIGKGTGLGLATVYGIVKQSGGTLDVSSELGRGTTFRIFLPVTASGEEEQSKAETPVVAAAGSETVLVVEDEESVRNLTVDYLKAQGYRVLAARDGEEAVRVAANHNGDIHLLVTDVIMPGMSGRALADALLKFLPHLRVLFVSGYVGDDLAHRDGLDDHERFLQKPYTLSSLAGKLREVLQRSA